MTLNDDRHLAATVSIIIPAFNESHCIGHLIESIKELYPHFEVVVVDDGSSDATAQVAAAAGATVYRHPYNIGNGAAVKTGIRKARGQKLVFMDGDGQHDPRDIRILLEALKTHDLVVGARPKKGGQASFARALGNRLYNRMASYVAKFPIQDLTSGFRAVRANVAQEFIYLLPNTYSYPTTITLGVLRTGRTLAYVPINVRKRQGGSSNIRVFSDGVKFFIIITKICTLFSPFRVFLPVSGAMFMFGLIRYLYTFFTEGRFTNMSALFFVSSVILFMMSLISEQICQLRYERRVRSRNVERYVDATDANSSDMQDPSVDTVYAEISPPNHPDAP
ncbi:MAG: glycosyltransferase family 2 protein [Desulfosarcinaceae bacterium]|nr:glycosyltransferase family 2 protein [Desulfosarcinaceae bacterium]